MSELAGRTFLVTGGEHRDRAGDGDGSGAAGRAGVDRGQVCGQGRGGGGRDKCAERAPSPVATPELAAELWKRSEMWTAPL